MDTNVVRTKPFFDRIRSIGYQPFIQIGVQSRAETDFLICHTQQELGQLCRQARQVSAAEAFAVPGGAACRDVAGVL